MSRIPLWIDLRGVPINKRLPYIHAIEEMAAERVLLERGDPHETRQGLNVVTIDGKNTIREGKKPVGRLIKLKDAKTQARAAAAAGIVVIEAQDWTIIPLENLIAARRDRPGTLFAHATTPQQAILFAQTLEVGVHGVVLAPAGAQAIFECDQMLRALPPSLGTAASDMRVRDAVLGEAGVEDAKGTLAGHGARVGAATSQVGSATPQAGSGASRVGGGASRVNGGDSGFRGAAQRAPTVQDSKAAGRPSTAIPKTRDEADQTSRPPSVDRQGSSASLSATMSTKGGPGGQTPARPAAPSPARPFLENATITAVQDAGMGDRVCIDTTSLFREGEGLLVGSASRSFILVAAETMKNPYVEARPFRVNAGAVHSYLFVPDGKTRYLSELQSGQPVMAVHPDGIHRVLQIGRCKIERRPHVRVTWQTPQGPAQAVVQNAETVRFLRPDGTAVAVTSLRPGDEVLVHHETAARHFGMPVDESLEER